MHPLWSTKPQPVRCPHRVVHDTQNALYRRTLMTGEPMHSTALPSYINYHLKSEVHILPAMFNPLHSSMNQKLVKSTFAIKVATMKNTNVFCYEGKPLLATAKSTLFNCQQR